MSYEPPPGPVPTFYVPPPPAPPAPPAPPRSGRRRWAIALGVVLLVAGVAGGAVMFVLSSRQVDKTVKRFARAPVGCTTTLQFEKKAVFTIYVETKGVPLEIGGDCATSGKAYDRTDAAPPTVSLSLVDGNDTPVTLADSSAYSYDTGDYRGAAVQQVTIDQPGTYRLRVESKDTDFAIAIGGDPNVDTRAMKYVGASAVAGGMLLGVLLILIGLRRRTPPAPEEAAHATVVVPPPPPFQVPTTPPGTPVAPPWPGTQLPPPPPPPSGFRGDASP